MSHHVKGLFLIWPPGIGKTHPAFGIDLKAIDAVYVVCFSTALTLIEALEPAELKYELKKINRILKFHGLINDDTVTCP